MYEARWNAACYTQTTGIQNLDSDTYLGMLVPMRTLDEQRELAGVLDELLRRRLDAEAQMASLKLLLAERKRALITACVSGEFDVRTASSRAADAALAGLPKLG